MHLRIGFVPLADCAPLVVASEKGLFEAHGVSVELAKVQNWAQLHEKLESGEFQAAHALATLPLTTVLGLDGTRTLLTSAWTLSTGANAITLSNRLYRAGVRDAADLARWLASPEAPERLVLGAVHPHSTHEFMLREWLREGGLEFGGRILLEIHPPQEMVRRLREGRIEGFCAGEPWNQRASTSKLGGIVAVGEQVAAPQAEKVLAVRQDWHAAHRPAHIALLRALDEASRWLEDPEHLDEAAALLAGKRHVNTQEILLRDALARRLAAGWGRTLGGRRLLRFYGPGVNRPDVAALRWYLERLVWSGEVPASALEMDLEPLALAGFHDEVFPEGDGTDRLFGFEDASLGRVPMAVRRKLDLAGLKLGSQAWHRLDETIRRVLLLRPARSEGELARWSASLLQEVAASGGEPPAHCPPTTDPPWLWLDRCPTDLVERARAEGIAIPLSTWRSLDELQRFALVKLSRPSHGGEDFQAAVAEFSAAETT